MHIKYVADDYREFASAEECIAHDRLIVASKTPHFRELIKCAFEGCTSEDDRGNTAFFLENIDRMDQFAINLAVLLYELSQTVEISLKRQDE